MADAAVHVGRYRVGPRLVIAVDGHREIAAGRLVDDHRRLTPSSRHTMWSPRRCAMNS